MNSEHRDGERTTKGERFVQGGKKQLKVSNKVVVTWSRSHRKQESPHQRRRLRKGRVAAVLVGHRLLLKPRRQPACRHFLASPPLPLRLLLLPLLAVRNQGAALLSAYQLTTLSGPTSLLPPSAPLRPLPSNTNTSFFLLYTEARILPLLLLLRFQPHFCPLNLLYPNI